MAMLPSLSPGIGKPLFTMLLLLFFCSNPSLSEQQNQEQSCSNNHDHDSNTCTASSSMMPVQEGPSPVNEIPADNYIELPDDFIDPCQDTEPSCYKWAVEGECRKNTHYMFASCAKSCGTCQPLPRGDRGSEEGEEIGEVLCFDKHSGGECRKWAMEGQCLINPTFMRSECKYSCWECVDKQRDELFGIPSDEIRRKVVYATMDLGKQQLIREINDDATDNDPMASEEYSTVLSTIRQMEHYAKYIMTDASVDIKTRLRCRNDFRMCAEWASRGLCHSTSSRATKDDVLFMMNFCPLACGTCHLLESFHKCVGRRHPHAQPSFESGGDLRSFFDKATTINGDGSIEGDWAEYEPVLASDGKDDGSYVVIFQNFVSDEEADHLTSLGSAIDNGLTASTIKTPTTSSDDTTTNVNNAEYASCHDDDQCDSDDVYQRIMNRIASLSDSISISHLEPIAFKRLHPTSAEKSLQHNFEVGSSWKPAGPRVLSLSLFLWTVSDDDGNESGGGGIGFPYLDWLYVRPRKGTAVLWTNVREDDLIKPDLSMRFEYMPVQNGGGGEESVVVSTVHVHLYNWTDANMRGCA